MRLRPAAEDPGDADGAGPRAAGEGFAGASLPHAHADLVRRDDLHEFGVDPLGKSRVPSRPTAPTPNTQSSSVSCVDKCHAMRIAHRDARHRNGSAADFQGDIDDGAVRPAGIAGQGGGDSLGRQDRLAHIDAHPPDHAVADFQFDRQHAAAGLDPQRRILAQPVVVDVLGDAADAVAAHFRLGAVGVEHPHPGVGPLAGTNEDQAVAADAEMAVGDSPRQFGGLLGHRFGEAIDVDVVVARPLHLREIAWHAPDGS